MGPGSRTAGPDGYQRPTKRARTGGRGRGKGKGKARGRGKAKQGQPRDFVPEVVKIDKASALRLKGKQITGTDAMGGGYRMARASHGTDSGCWYYEVHIDKDKVAAQDAAYRVGFAHKKADLQGPCGMDRYSFGYRNIEGSLVYASHRVDQANEPYKAGDIIGCLINFQSDELEDIESDHPADDSAFPKDPKSPRATTCATSGTAGTRASPSRTSRRAPTARRRRSSARAPSASTSGPASSAGRCRRASRRGCRRRSGRPSPSVSWCRPSTRSARSTPSRRRERRSARIEQARAEAEEKKAAEAKAQKDALKNARRNAARGRELGLARFDSVSGSYYGAGAAVGCMSERLAFRRTRRRRSHVRGVRPREPVNSTMVSTTSSGSCVNFW